MAYMTQINTYIFKVTVVQLTVLKGEGEGEMRVAMVVLS